MRNLNLFIGLTIFCGCCIFASCDSDELSEKEKTDITKRIVEKVDGYFDAVTRLDANWLNEEFWANVDGFTIASNGDLVADFESGIATPTVQWFQNVKEVLYTGHSNGHIYVLSEDAGSYTTEFRWGIVTLTDDTVKSCGSWTYVFKEFEDDNWKVVHSAGAHKYE